MIDCMETLIKSGWNQQMSGSIQWPLGKILSAAGRIRENPSDGGEILITSNQIQSVSGKIQLPLERIQVAAWIIRTNPMNYKFQKSMKIREKIPENWNVKLNKPENPWKSSGRQGKSNRNQQEKTRASRNVKYRQRIRSMKQWENLQVKSLRGILD